MIIEALRVIFSPLGYLKARNATKLYWDWIFPSLIAMATCCLFATPWIHLTIFGEKGVVHGVNELLQVLVGFYIAALAAVASLANPSLDRGISGEPILLGKNTLSRRQFLCLALSYLSLLSIIVYGMGLASELTADTFREAVPAHLHLYFRGIFGVIYGLSVAQLGCITSVTLFYLGERIHVGELTANPTEFIPIDPAANQEGPHFRTSNGPEV